jgi:hypothetical protein
MASPQFRRAGAGFPRESSSNAKLIRRNDVPRHVSGEEARDENDDQG